MSKALIIDTIPDAWRDTWCVREYRHTNHGFDVALGWPEGIARGRGGAGGVKIIVTPELIVYFEAHRLAPGKMSLPIGMTSIKRIRRLLGHHRQIDRAAWWEERVVDLLDLSVTEFSKRHAVSIGAASQARAALCGNKVRPAGWWQQPDIAEIIASDRPRAEIADMLEISVGAVGRLRWQVQK